MNPHADTTPFSAKQGSLQLSNSIEASEKKTRRQQPFFLSRAARQRGRSLRQRCTFLLCKKLSVLGLLSPAS